MPMIRERSLVFMVRAGKKNAGAEPSYPAIPPPILTARTELTGNDTVACGLATVTVSSVKVSVAS